MTSRFLVIDPEGKLVEGDLETLARKLSHTQDRQSA
jgi:hypothetical protein